jgi:hypothetical protein
MLSNIFQPLDSLFSPQVGAEAPTHMNMFDGGDVPEHLPNIFHELKTTPRTEQPAGSILILWCDSDHWLLSSLILFTVSL